MSLPCFTEDPSGPAGASSPPLPYRVVDRRGKLVGIVHLSLRDNRFHGNTVSGSLRERFVTIEAARDATLAAATRPPRGKVRR